MLCTKKKPSSPVHIGLRPPEIIHRYHNPRGERRQLPASTVVPQTPDRPQQQWRRRNVKQAQQPNPQRDAWIEHVFRSANVVMTGQESQNEVDDKQNLKKQQLASLPRENQRAFHPESERDENIPEIAEEKKVLQAILPAINRRPHQGPHRPQQLQPEWDAHQRHCIRKTPHRHRQAPEPFTGKVKRSFRNYHRNLMRLTGVPTMTLI